MPLQVFVSFLNLNFIDQLQFTFSILLYGFQVYCIVVRHSQYPPGTIHSYYDTVAIFPVLYFTTL